MSSPSLFKHYLICQDVAGKNIELIRSGEQVAVLAFDSQRFLFVHCHVLMEPLADRGAFEDRARVLQKEGHPLLARMLDFGEDEGSPYYITANIDGEPLRDLISRHEEIPVWLAMQLAALAIGAVHALGERGDFLSRQPLSVLRVVQTGLKRLQVCVADYQLTTDSALKAGRSRDQKAGFSRQAQILMAFFADQLRNAGGAEAMLSGGDFSELLHALLVSITPGLGAALDELRNTLTSLQPPSPPGDLAALYKPKPLIVPLLASFQEVARCVAQSVRMQSQRLDPSQPYALRGKLMKTGQGILVEQVPPFRLVGAAPSGALQQAVNSPKSGKLPNLMPVVFVEEHDGIECFAETAVEGITLAELLEARGALDPQEVYRVLADLDVALSQFENAGRANRRLRLEDIYLFTGFGHENPRDTGLLEQKLNEWPGFSIVLRGHPCLHSMVGRGTDPAVLLPIRSATTSGLETLWNGEWLAVLAACLLGRINDVKESSEPDTIALLMNDELALARGGSPGSRPAFLGRFARAVRELDLAQISGGGFWTEMGGSKISIRTAPEVRLKAAVNSPEIMPASDELDLSIGFAEALMRPFAENQIEEPDESSWNGFRKRRPFWIKPLVLLIVAIAAAAWLANSQGRALWQRRTSEAKIPSRSGVGPDGLPAVPLTHVPVTPLLPPPDERSFTVSEKLVARLRELRQSGAKLPDDLRGPTEKAAQKGNTEAMIALGSLLLRADSGNVDEHAAFVWFDKALVAGDKAAIVPLAGCYLQGWGTKPDFSQAVNLLTKAVSEGDKAAGDLLGVCYLGGLGVTRDEARAFQLFTEARKAGVASASGNLGNMYLKGKGVPADATRAVTLFAEGARQGHAESMLFYAQCIENGTGI
ncbi:MAG: Sel1-like repeat-containing protein kinase family protein, partial [Verrucomicrobiaceae bacterium]